MIGNGTVAAGVTVDLKPAAGVPSTPGSFKLSRGTTVSGPGTLQIGALSVTVTGTDSVANLSNNGECRKVGIVLVKEPGL
jgi:hypothetical protein